MKILEKRRIYAFKGSSRCHFSLGYLSNEEETVHERKSTGVPPAQQAIALDHKCTGFSNILAVVTH